MQQPSPSQQTSHDQHGKTIANSIGRRHVAVAVLLILTMTLIATTSASFLVANKDQQAMQIELQSRAKMLARSIDMRLQVYQTALMTIAQSSTLQGDLDVEKVADEMQRLGDLFGGWFVVTLDGVPVTPFRNPKDPAAPGSGPNQPEVTFAEDESLRLRRSVISDVFLENISDELTFTTVMPIGSTRSLTAFIKALVTLGKITAWVEEATLAEGEVATLADGSRRVIARSRETNELIFSGLPDWYIRFSAGLDSGVTVGPQMEGGVQRLFAMQRLETAPGWTVTLSRPLPSVFSATIRSAWPALSALFVFLISSGFAAFTLDRIRSQGIAADNARAAIERERLLVEIRAADARKARLMAVLAHDLRTPLIAILGSLDLLHAAKDSDSRAHVVERAQRDGHSMLQLIDDVLELARLGAGERRVRSESFVPATFLEEVADLVRTQASKQDTKVVTQIGDLPPLQGDVVALRRILMNFASNAVKATQGGSVLLSVAADQKGPDGYLVTFSVTDTGHGISADDIPRLFQDFGMLEREEAAQQGTGLGLAICRRLAEAMGGSVGVESRVDKGSRFWVQLTLPRADRVKINQMHSTEDPALVLSGLRVLVAEDHDTIRQLTCARLTQCGAKTTEAADGAEAVALADANKFDLILMDLQMPRLDGAEAAKRIRNGGGASAKARIVGLSAHQTPTIAAMLSNLAIEAFLSKPIDLKQLAALWTGTEQLESAPPPVTGDFDSDAIGTLRSLDGGALLIRTLRQLAKEIVVARVELATLIHDGDVEGAKRLSHKLAGFCDILGARYLSETLKDFETLNEDKDTETLANKLQETQAVMDITRRQANRLADEIEDELGPAAGTNDLR